MLHADGVCGLHRSAGEDKYIMHNVRAKGQNSDKVNFEPTPKEFIYRGNGALYMIIQTEDVPTSVPRRNLDKTGHQIHIQWCTIMYWNWPSACVSFLFLDSVLSKYLQ